MSTALQRGMMLFGQGRHDLADREFRRELSEDPDSVLAHAFLALCLLSQSKHDDALREADEAIRIAPDLAFCHFARGHALLAMTRYRDAEASAAQAVELDPDDADFRSLKANIALARRRWTEALEFADQGLALEPDHSSCLNARAMALTQLGRRDEANHTLGSALADDPDDAFTHANQGWLELHRGDHVRALDHFREALRLDPTMDWARQGIVEALKARHLIYRLMLRFSLWLGRQSQKAQWAFLLAFMFGRRILSEIAQSFPTAKPFIQPILLLSFAFLMLTWVASPLFNMLLRFNRFGRLALSDEQRTASTWIGGCAVVAMVCLAANLVTGNSVAFLAAAYFGLLLLPLTVTFGRPAGRPRLIMAVATAALALLPWPMFSVIALGEASPFAGNLDRAMNFWTLFIVGAAASSWLPALFQSRDAWR